MKEVDPVVLKRFTSETLEENLYYMHYRQFPSISSTMGFCNLKITFCCTLVKV